MRTTIKNFALSTAGALLLSAGMISGNAAHAMAIDPNVSLPGIAPAGQPAFTFNDWGQDYSERVKSWYSNVVYVESRGLGNGYTLYGYNSGLFTYEDASNNTFAGTNGVFDLRANFDDSGNFVDGTMTLTGIINDLGIITEVNLVTADLVSYAFEDDLVGFGIDITSCAAQIDCNDVPESVYFFTLGNMVDIGDLNGTDYRTTMANKTTVPLPAGVWLLLSALGLTGALTRRR